jgi:hypothetical protein
LRPFLVQNGWFCAEYVEAIEGVAPEGMKEGSEKQYRREKTAFG